MSAEYVREHFTQWIVWVRDIAAGEDRLLGPYRTEQGARRVADRLGKNIAALGATEAWDAGVMELRSGRDVEGFREELLTALRADGFERTDR